MLRLASHLGELSPSRTGSSTFDGGPCSSASFTINITRCVRHLVDRGRRNDTAVGLLARNLVERYEAAFNKHIPPRHRRPATAIAVLSVLEGVSSLRAGLGPSIGLDDEDLAENLSLLVQVMLFPKFDPALAASELLYQATPRKIAGPTAPSLRRSPSPERRIVPGSAKDRLHAAAVTVFAAKGYSNTGCRRHHRGSGPVTVSLLPQLRQQAGGDRGARGGVHRRAPPTFRRVSKHRSPRIRARPLLGGSTVIWTRTGSTPTCSRRENELLRSDEQLGSLARRDVSFPASRDGRLPRTLPAPSARLPGHGGVRSRRAPGTLPPLLVPLPLTPSTERPWPPREGGSCTAASSPETDRWSTWTPPPSTCQTVRSSPMVFPTTSSRAPPGEPGVLARAHPRGDRPGRRRVLGPHHL